MSTMNFRDYCGIVFFIVLCLSFSGLLFRDLWLLFFFIILVISCFSLGLTINQKVN